MSVLIRLALALGLVLLAGGTLVAPHEPVAGWSHLGLDHPPSRLQSALLGHAMHHVAAAPAAIASPTFSAATSAPASVALSTLALALLASYGARLWRPGAHGVRRPIVRLADAQQMLAPAPRPPRASFSS